MKLEDLAANHSYYCSTGNYYSNDCTFQYETVDDFLEEMGESDLDYNLCFRFDVKKYDPDDFYEEDVIPEGCFAEIFMMQQRKGRFVCCQIQFVKDEDAEKLSQWLQKRYNYLKSLWKPFE